MSPPAYAMSFKSFICSTGGRDFERGRDFRPLDFVRGIIERDGWDRDIPGSAMPMRPLYAVEHNPDIVNIKIIRNNTFVTVTDSKGNKKLGATAGSLSGTRGPKSDAIAEHAGRLSRNLGLKSVIMKVNGFTFFKRKRQAILGWKEGFNSSRGDENPIVYLEDTTRRAHNGCRLPKKRRIKGRKRKSK